jgi:hypothetical protein
MGRVFANSGGSYTASRGFSMTNDNSNVAAEDTASAFYRLIQRQTKDGRTAGRAGAIGACTFIVVAVLIVVALEVGVDLQELLAGIIAIATVNVVISLVYASQAARNR